MLGYIYAVKCKSSRILHPLHPVQKFTSASKRPTVRAGNYSKAWKSNRKCKRNSYLFEPLNKTHSNTFLNNQELQSNCPRMQKSHNMSLKRTKLKNNLPLDLKVNMATSSVQKVKYKSHLVNKPQTTKLIYTLIPDSLIPELASWLTNENMEEGLHFI